MLLRNTKGKNAIIFGTIFSFLGLVLNVVSGFVFTPWIISTLGSSNYGLFTLSNSLISIFLLDFGLAKTVDVYLSRFRAKNEENKIPGFLGLVLKIYIAIDVLILVAFTVVYFLIPYLYQGLSLEERQSFQIIFIITASFSLLTFPTSIFSGVLFSYERFSVSKIIDIITKILHIAFSAVILAFDFGIYIYVLANSSISLVSNLLKYIFLRFGMKVRIDFFKKNGWKQIKGILSFSIWAFISAIAGRLLLAFVPSILGIVSDSNNIAAYGVASSLENYIFMFGSITTSFFAPTIAKILAISSPIDRGKKLNDVAVKASKIQFCMMFLIFGGFIVCGKTFIDIWIKGGEEYDASYVSTILLVIPNLFSVPESFLYSTMYQKNMVKHIAIPEIIGGVVNVGLCFLFGKIMGCVGVCLAVCVTRLLIIFVQTLFYKEYGGFDIFNLFKKSLLPIVFNSFAPLLLSLIVQRLCPSNLYVRLLIPGVMIMLSFVLFNYLFSFSKEEKKYYKSAFLGSFKRK